ncbi:putative F-box protein At3g10430 [Neltuma alba]|uniref:putative F-box protein At3g10430 n=1 Tax=Neltuma alba TaxID=207710 RepID=UPI0010A4A6B4|nr:putative F-box protein At3g10430 [Prosopis alba]
MASDGGNLSLPSEIVINILKRLPVKSIVRFQSVCKNWKNLFKTPHFIAEHARHSSHENPLLLLHEKDFVSNGKPPSLRLLNYNMETIEVLSIPSIDCLKHGWKIIGSCNGLLCAGVDLDPDGSPRSLCLWNPVIREVREIPLTTTTKDYWGLCEFGFGFSSNFNDYKIVKFYIPELRKKKKKRQPYNADLLEHHRSEVYSLSTGLWKKLEFGALPKTTIISKNISAEGNDGTILFLGEKDNLPVLVSFDIATEVFRLTQIPLPRDLPTAIGVYQNKLAMFRHCNISFHSIHIWAMEEVAGESGKSFSFTEEFKHCIISYFFHPLCIWRNEIVCVDKERWHLDEDEDECYDESVYFLRLLNLTTKKWKEFYKVSSSYDWCDGFNYERSLVSVWNAQVE